MKNIRPRIIEWFKTPPMRTRKGARAMALMAPDVEASTQPIKVRKKKMNEFKKFAPPPNAGSTKYRKQVMKGPVKGKMFVGGAKYKGA